MEVKEKKPGRDGCRGIGAEKPVVAVDVDEVLGKFLVPMCHFHNARYGTSLSPLDFHSYRFSDVWGGTDDEAARKVHEFFETHFFREEVRICAFSATDGMIRDYGYIRCFLDHILNSLNLLKGLKLS